MTKRHTIPVNLSESLITQLQKALFYLKIEKSLPASLQNFFQFVCESFVQRDDIKAGFQGYLDGEKPPREPYKLMIIRIEPQLDAKFRTELARIIVERGEKVQIKDFFLWATPYFLNSEKEMEGFRDFLVQLSAKS